MSVFMLRKQDEIALASYTYSPTSLHIKSNSLMCLRSLSKMF